MKFTNEQLAKARETGSAEELYTLAKENGIGLTAEDAARHYADLHCDRTLSDDELDNVFGGCGEPQEYDTMATWLASGCGCNSFSPRDSNEKEKCGNCRHFKRTDGSNGKCRREF